MMKYRRGKRYDKWYFEEKYKYGRKRLPIVRYYMDVLRWANRYVNWNILRGFGRRALDIGCAYGFIVDMHHSLGYETYGVDFSSYALERGKELEISNLLMGDGSNPPFISGIFNLITCFETLEHLSSPEDALSSVYKLLSPKGVFIATTNLGRFDVSPISYIFTYLLAREPQELHPSVKSPREWHRAFLELGFKHVLIEPFLILPLPPTLLDRYFTLRTPTPLAYSVKILAVKGCEH
jgi:SAM-dependent methyltransferase